MNKVKTLKITDTVNGNFVCFIADISLCELILPLQETSLK